MTKSNLILRVAIASIFIISLWQTTALKAQEVKIGSQIWSASNLNVGKFQNGDPIPQANSDMEWMMAAAQKKPMWCYFKFDAENGGKHGKLYNAYAIMDVRGLAPKGWKIPSDSDWKILEENIGKDGGRVSKAESNDTKLSISYSGTINESGLFMEQIWGLWTSTKVSKTGAFGRMVYEGSSQINRKVRRNGDGLSIRLIKE